MKEIMGKDKLSKFDKRFGPDFPSDREIPTVLILKRKAIRVYPDNQKIALYYSQALDKYVSIPFGPGTASLGVHINEARKPTKAEQETMDALRGAGYHTIAGEYEKHKKTGDVDKALTRIARKMSPSQIRKLPKHERKAIQDRVKAGISSADKSVAWKVGARTGVALGNVLANLTSKSKPKSTTPKTIPESNHIKESFKNKVSVLREEQEIDESIGIAAKLGWEALKMGAKLGVRRGKAAYLKAKRSKLGRGAGAVGSGLIGAAGLASAIGQSAAGGEAQFTKPGEFGHLDVQQIVGGPGQRDTLDYSKRGDIALTNPRMAQKLGLAENNLNIIKHIVENDIKSHELHFGDRTVPLNNSVAKKVLKIYESVNKTNKKKIEKMLNEDVTSFRKVINFAIRQ